MKKILLFAFSAILSVGLSAQCAPDAHDWGTATYGVSPDPTLGETFQSATLGVSYADIIYVKAPSQAGDIDPAYAAFNVAIDSLHLDSITINNGIADISLSNIGLNVTCNNNGVAPNPCTFLGGGAYCGDISGTPTAAGVFPVKIYVTAFINFFGPQAVPYQFENYTLTVLDPNLVKEEVAQNISVGQNSPNPVSFNTDIEFELAKPEVVSFTVTNLVGARVHERKINARRGSNVIKFDSSELENGIYLYSIECSGKKYTRRMVVQH